MKIHAIFVMLFGIFFFNGCDDKVEDIGEDELDIQREEDYDQDDLSQKELQLRKSGMTIWTASIPPTGKV
jgi:hypothetical protein